MDMMTHLLTSCFLCYFSWVLLQFFFVQVHIKIELLSARNGFHDLNDLITDTLLCQLFFLACRTA